MTLQATTEAPNAAVLATATYKRPADMDAKFQRMLAADRNSSEFAELWAEVDAYIDAALATRKVTAA